MDTKKIGAFLKQCRKEKNLTQEQLAEKFGVSARTVSRWETGSNMPDLSILVELADYYDIEIKELLDGERSSTMNKEMKETLNKVADYEDWVKQKALKAGNLAFASMFLISVGAIIIQLLLAVNLRLVLGETLIALVGGIVYAFIMVHNGIWDKGLSAREALWRDFLTSVICAGIFSVFYGICLRSKRYISLYFFWVELQSWHLLFSEYYHILTGTDAGFQLMGSKEIFQRQRQAVQKFTTLKI